MNNNNTYEMILCVVNAGFSDSVMDAAKEAGGDEGEEGADARFDNEYDEALYSSEDSEADSAPGRAGRPRHTRPRRPGTTARASEGKEGHGLALGFRIVSEFDLLIPKKTIQSHVQK